MSRIGKAELSSEVTLALWRDNDTWRAECLEIAAVASGATSREAYRLVVEETYRVAQATVNAGELPARSPSEVSDAARAVARRMAGDGGKRAVDELFEDAEVHEIVTFLRVKLQIGVPNLDGDPGVGDLNVLIVPDGGAWSAQCLEYDLGGEGSSQIEALAAFGHSLLAQVTMDRALGLEPLARVPRAPQRYWAMYNDARESVGLKPPASLGSVAEVRVITAA